MGCGSKEGDGCLGLMRKWGERSRVWKGDEKWRGGSIAVKGGSVGKYRRYGMSKGEKV